MSFLEQGPPDELYEDTPFSVNIFIENKGAFNVINEKYAVLSINFDPFYIKTDDVQSNNNVEVTNNGITVKGLKLYGKSKYYPSGSDLFLSFPNFRTKEIKGQREKPSTQIYASLCYPYLTQFSDLVCVDLNTYGQNLRKQVCNQKDLTPSSQGAPVAVTKVEVENQPAGQEAVRPVFTIHVKNKGGGTVVSPLNNAPELDRVCAFTELNREDFNTIDVRAILSNEKELECKPNPIRLFDNEGFTRCAVKEDDLILGHQNYQTPLNINLSYVYLTSDSHDIDIKRFNIFGGSDIALGECLPSEIQEGTACISKCSFCAKNPNDHRCQPENAKYTINFKKGFACQCKADTCSKLYPKGLCVPFSNFCFGATYCCLPECRGSEVMIDGICYPKCSECKTNGNDEDCACGLGDDETKYVVSKKSEYCCPEIAKSHTIFDSCDAECNPPAENDPPANT